MNRDHLPCRACARFLPTGGQKPHEGGAGLCQGFDRPAHSTYQPCVLFAEQGTWETRKAQMPPDQRARQAPARETISRASAPSPRPVRTTTTTERA